MLDDFLPGFERHLRILQGLTAGSVRIYTRKVLEFATWFKARHPSNPVTAVTRQDIEAYLEHCFYRGNSNNTRATKHVAITKFFRYLLYERLIDEDVSSDIPRIRRKKTFIQKFTKLEILRIFSALDITTEKGLRDACIFILAAFGGLRAGEIVALSLQDLIDEEGKSLDVHITGKFGKERQIYLWKIPSDILRRWLAVRLTHGARAADSLFVTYGRLSRHKDRRMTIVDLDHLLKFHAARAAIAKPKITMHMFRAAHASDLRHVNGYDTPAIAERLGHASIATTDKYIPTRGRIHKVYPSLAAYWREFNTIWPAPATTARTTTAPAATAPSAQPQKRSHDDASAPGSSSTNSTLPPGGDTGA